MPRARNTGFVFNKDPHTIAHELGHGAFGLKHIFAPEELGEGYIYQTDNLMDYSQIDHFRRMEVNATIENPGFIFMIVG